MTGSAVWRWGPPVVWMAVVSAGSTDAFAAAETGRIIGPLLRWLFPAALPGTIELLHGAIRTLGHLTEYGVLALLWYRTLAWRAAAWHRDAALRSLLLAAGFAVLDEIHQAFELSRSGRLLDVGWDALGAVLGLLARRLTVRSGLPLSGWASRHGCRSS